MSRIKLELLKIPKALSPKKIFAYFGQRVQILGAHHGCNKGHLAKKRRRRLVEVPNSRNTIGETLLKFTVC